MEASIHHSSELKLKTKRFAHKDGTLNFDVLYLEKNGNQITLYFEEENDMYEFAVKLCVAIHSRKECEV